MKITQLITNSNLNDSALLFYSLLNRIPILITGVDEQEIETVLGEIPLLIPFRAPILFYSDFVNYDDYENLIENETLDYETNRNLFICYPFAIEKLFSMINKFNSWIIGLTNFQLKNSYNIYHTLYNNHDYFLKIEITNDTIHSIIQGRVFKNINLSFERELIKEAILKTEISIEKMKRIISKQLKIKKNSNEEFQQLLDFSLEEEDLKTNFIIRKIEDFYQASKRAFNILNRLRTIETYGIKTKIAIKTLLTTISYKEASISRILEFIQNEWYSKYENFVENKKISNFTDTFESLWG